MHIHILEPEYIVGHIFAERDHHIAIRNRTQRSCDKTRFNIGKIKNGILAIAAASFGSVPEPVSGCIFAAVILGQRPGGNVLLGAVFILASIALTSLHGVRKGQENHHDRLHGEI